MRNTYSDESKDLRKREEGKKARLGIWDNWAQMEN